MRGATDEIRRRIAGGDQSLLLLAKEQWTSPEVGEPMGGDVLSYLKRQKPPGGYREEAD